MAIKRTNYSRIHQLILQNQSKKAPKRPEGFTKSKTELAKEKAAAYNNKEEAKKKAFALRSQKQDPKAKTLRKESAKEKAVAYKGNSNIQVKGNDNSNIGNNYSNNNGRSRPVVSRPVVQPPENNRPVQQPSVDTSTPRKQLSGGYGNYEEWSKNRFQMRTADWQDYDNDGIDNRDQAGPGQPRFSDYVDGKPPSSGNDQLSQDQGLDRVAFAKEMPNRESAQKRYRESMQQFKDQYTSNLKRRGVGNKSTNIDVTGNNNSNVGNDYSNNTTNQNDYSVNISGNNRGRYGGFSNMQGAAAYSALNNNQARRSNSELSGSTSAAQVSEDADRIVDGRGRAKRLYNMTGFDQNYWRSKADAQQNFYLGDIFKMNLGDYKLPSPPSNPFDNDRTDEYYDDAIKRIENK